MSIDSARHLLDISRGHSFWLFEATFTWQTSLVRLFSLRIPHSYTHCSQLGMTCLKNANIVLGGGEKKDWSFWCRRVFFSLEEKYSGECTCASLLRAPPRTPLPPCLNTRHTAAKLRRARSILPEGGPLSVCEVRVSFRFCTCVVKVNSSPMVNGERSRAVRVRNENAALGGARSDRITPACRFTNNGMMYSFVLLFIIYIFIKYVN